MFLLQLSESRGIVFSRAIVSQSRAMFVYSIIGLIYSQGWQLNVNKLPAVNANTLKTYKYRGN